MQEKSKSLYGWYLVIISALIGCILSAGFPQFTMAVGDLSSKMGATEESLLLGDTVKTIAVVLSMMISGLCYRKFGARKTIILGMLVQCIPQVIYPFNNSLILFYLLKFTQGFASIIFPVFLLLIMEVFGEGKEGLPTAVFNGIFYGGAGVGATLAGFINEKWGWEVSFYAIAALVAIFSLIWAGTIQEEDAEMEEEKVDTGVSYGDLLKKPETYLLIFAFIPTTFIVQAVSVDLPLYSDFLGYSNIETGKLGIAVTIGMVLACLVSGVCSDYFAEKGENSTVSRIRVLMVGCVVSIVAIAILLGLASKGFSMLYISVLLFSFGGSWGLGVFYSILPGVYTPDELQIATGFVGGFGDMMMPIAPLIVGVMLGVKGLWNQAWLVCGALALLGVVSCIVLINIIKKSQA